MTTEEQLAKTGFLYDDVYSPEGYRARITATAPKALTQDSKCLVKILDSVGNPIKRVKCSSRASAASKFDSCIDKIREGEIKVRIST